MSTMLGNIVQGSTNINDEVIASDMLEASKGTANAYLNATLTSTTPELRAMYSNSLTQVVGGYSALSDLAVNRGWEKPYNPPSQQLFDAYIKSKDTLES